MYRIDSDRPIQIQQLEQTLQDRGLFPALTTQQRIAIRDGRDGGGCLFPEPHVCTPNRLEVHHIQPQKWGEIHGIPRDTIDNPYNVITICSEAHDRIHPERKNARARYSVDKDSFKNSRPTWGKDGVYWNTMYDGQLFAVARERTENAKIDGWSFPD